MSNDYGVINFDPTPYKPVTILDQSNISPALQHEAFQELLLLVAHDALTYGYSDNPYDKWILDSFKMDTYHPYREQYVTSDWYGQYVARDLSNDYIASHIMKPGNTMDEYDHPMYLDWTKPALDFRDEVREYLWVKDSQLLHYSRLSGLELLGRKVSWPAPGKYPSQDTNRHRNLVKLWFVQMNAIITAIHIERSKKGIWYA